MKACNSRMILELFENIAMLPIIIAVCYMIILTIVELNKGLTTIKSIKMFFCVMLSFAIVVSILIVTILNVYQVATIWKEYEVDNVLDPRVKSISFTAIILIWNLVGVALIILFWRFIYFHQIIPGVGNIKMRLKNILKNPEVVV